MYNFKEQKRVYKVRNENGDILLFDSRKTADYYCIQYPIYSYCGETFVYRLELSAEDRADELMQQPVSKLPKEVSRFLTRSACPSIHTALLYYAQEVEKLECKDKNNLCPVAYRKFFNE